VICSVESCDTPINEKGARGMCSRHYQYWLRTGSPVKPCLGCGEPVNGSRFAKYCSDTCKPRCSVDGCCGAVRKRGWCASHYAQHARTGAEPAPFKWKWRPADLRSKPLTHAPKRPIVLAGPAPCGNCGVLIQASVYQQFCTPTCYQAYRLHGGPRPTTTNCVACGVAIDLTERGKRGQLRKAAVKFCRPCKRDYAKYKMSARELAERDGTDCGICHQPVDMTLIRAVDGLDCPSVDHILPRSRGGSHEPENLQLAHLRCNMLKSDRISVESRCV
jgi:hypothetical protein